MEEFRKSVRPDHSSEPPPSSHGLGTIEDSRKQVLKVVEDAMDHLQDIYLTAGYSPQEMSTYLLEFSEYIKSRCQSEVEKENEILELGRREVDRFQTEIHSLSQTLGRKCTTLDFTAKDSYNDRINMLRYQLEALENEKTERSNQMELRKAQVADLAHELGNDTRFAVKEEDISAEAFAQIELIHHQLNELKTKRQEKVLQLFNECYKVYSELAVFEEGFEGVRFGDDDERIDNSVIAYCEERIMPTGFVHIRFIENLEERYNGLLNEKERRRLELATLGEKIGKLWHHLQVDETDREAFQRSFDMKLSMKTLSVGKKELRRLRHLRSASLSRHVGEVRRAILRLWEESGLSEKNRIDVFPLFFIPVEEVDDEMVKPITYSTFINNF